LADKERIRSTRLSGGKLSAHVKDIGKAGKDLPDRVRQPSNPIGYKSE
jgi:hypothetical protein